MAGAWPEEPGRTQVIAKLNHKVSRQAFDETGSPVNLAAVQETRGEVYLEHGLNPWLTAQGKISYGVGEQDPLSRHGRADAELGLRARLLNKNGAVLSFYAGVAVPEASSRGSGGPEDITYEARLLVGRSYRLGRRQAFVDAQAAQRFAPNGLQETRVDATFGVQMFPNTLVLTQIYGGKTDRHQVWTDAELSLVQTIGDIKLQMGWRQTLAGQQVLLGKGPVVGIWHRF